MAPRPTPRTARGSRGPWSLRQRRPSRHMRREPGRRPRSEQRRALWRPTCETRPDGVSASRVQQRRPVPRTGMNARLRFSPLGLAARRSSSTPRRGRALRRRHGDGALDLAGSRFGHSPAACGWQRYRALLWWRRRRGRLCVWACGSASARSGSTCRSPARRGGAGGRRQSTGRTGAARSTTAPRKPRIGARGRGRYNGAVAPRRAFRGAAAFRGRRAADAGPRRLSDGSCRHETRYFHA
jgi:hypothetical protein